MSFPRFILEIFFDFDRLKFLFPHLWKTAFPAKDKSHLSVEGGGIREEKSPEFSTFPHWGEFSEIGFPRGFSTPEYHGTETEFPVSFDSDRKENTHGT